LPSIVRRIRREASGIDLVVSTSGPQESCRRIADDELDLTIGVFPHVPKELLSRALYRDTLICIADRRNPRLRNGRLDLKAYLESPHVTVARNRNTGMNPADYQLRPFSVQLPRTGVAWPETPHVTVARNRNTGMQIDEILEAMGLDRRMVVTVPHYLSVPLLVRGTDLVGHTRRRSLSVLRISSELATFPVPPPVKVPPLEFMQIWDRRYDGDPGHRWLRDLVLDAVKPGN
jgi:DNA-binding transcriptional LysR family regulator